MAMITAMGVPEPACLPSDYRFAGDDWSGSNALTYQVWQTAPVPAVLGPDGITVVTPAVPGVPYNLAGCSVSGTLRYRPQPVTAFPFRSASAGGPIQAPVGSIVGDPTQGEIALTLLRSVTSSIISQDQCAWGTPSQSMLIARPQVTDPSGNLVSIGDQPLFVF